MKPAVGNRGHAPVNSAVLNCDSEGGGTPLHPSPTRIGSTFCWSRAMKLATTSDEVDQPGVGSFSCPSTNARALTLTFPDRRARKGSRKFRECVPLFRSIVGCALIVPPG